ncbi:MAG: ComEC/Rec2 family competence protein [Pyrinomonadaceae bacterium]|nr:ComEC/Rec2 family competence protein [Pyrinomonadaceae bacterium]
MTNLDDESVARNFVLNPLAWLGLAFAGGIFAARFVEISAAFWFVIAVSCAGFVLFQRFKRSEIDEKVVTILILTGFFALGAASLELEKGNVASNRLSRIYDAGEISNQTPLEITGVLSKEPEQAVGGYFLNLTIENIAFAQTRKQVSGDVRLFLPLQTNAAQIEYKKLELRYGARIKVLSRITRDDRYRNSGYAPYQNLLANKGLDATGTLKSVLQIERLDDETVFLPLAWIYDWRQNALELCRKHFSVSTGGVLIASLLGNKYFLDKPTAERFREGGTFHVLVISGMQITIIGAWTVLLVRRFIKNRFWQFVAASAFLWSYSIAVGAESPVTRSALMFTVFHFVRIFNRESSALNALGASALVLLIVKPSDLFDQSFQLTFLSVTAIVAGAFPLLEKLRQIGAWQLLESQPAPPNCAKWIKTLAEMLFWSEKNWRRAQTESIWKCRLFKSETAKRLENYYLQTICRYIFAAFIVSIIVQMCLLPFTTIYFHRVSFVSLLMNVFVGALIALESLAAILSLLIVQFNELLAQPFILLTEFCNYLITASVTPFMNSSLHPPTYSGLFSTIYALYYVPVIFLLIAINRWNPFEVESGKLKVESKSKLLCLYDFANFRFVIPTVLTVLIALAALIIFPFGEPATNGRLRIDFLDVGQGDSILITFPNNAKMLIDGGGKPNLFSTRIERDGFEPETFAPDAQSIGESVVSRFLWARGIGKVDFILPTHADNDHIDGLNDVINNFKVDAAFAGRAPMKRESFATFAKTLQNQNIPLVKISRGDVLNFEGVKVEVLNPDFDANENADSDNPRSVVLRVTYGKRTFLLTGDIEKETEQLLLNQESNLRCDVVKVAHHGSKTSSINAFTQATKPTFAVVSVGRESPFGHPVKEVVENWRNAGAKVLTTGENGTISFTTNGEDLQLETFVK